MRILIVSPRTGGIGGVAQHVSKLKKELEVRGFEVDALSVENTLHIPIKGLYNPSFALFSAFKSLVRGLGGRRYDIAHGHNIPSWPAIRMARADARILTQHGVYSQQIKLLHGGFIGRLSGWLEGRAVKSVDALTCVSRSACEYYRRIGVDAVYIPNAVDLREMPAEGLRMHEKQVVYVGRLSYEKGVDVLFDAAEVLDPGVHLVVIGSGVKELEERARTLSKRLGNFHYQGYKPRDEALKVIKGSDLLVLPSRVEGLPTVLLEAMALKTPILSSRIPGVLDVVDDTCAVLIEPGNSRKLAEAINRCVNEYPKNFIERAYERVLREFNWDRVAQEYIRLYEALHSR